jgi:hypothetical protein
MTLEVLSDMLESMLDRLWSSADMLAISSLISSIVADNLSIVSVWSDILCLGSQLVGIVDERWTVVSSEASYVRDRQEALTATIS